MLAKPMDVLTTFPVRKTKKQKAAFRDAVQSYVQKLDYPCHIEKGSFGAQNIVIGDPENAKYLVTAHYDTSARMIVPNFISPCNLLVYSLYQASLIAKAFAAYCVGKTMDEIVAIEAGEDGKPADVDLAAGCTMHPGNFQWVVATASGNAK